MEPRSWKWIQAAVIILAAAIGVGVTLWYQNRPVDDALPAPVAMSKQKLVLRPFHSDVIPNAAPVKPGAANRLTTGSGTDEADSTGTVSASSQSSAYAAQNTVVDPMAHLRLPPPPSVLPIPPTSTVPAPVSPTGSAVTDSVPSASPYTALPSSPTAPVSPAPSSSVSPLVTTPPPVGGASAAPGATPGL